MRKITFLTFVISMITASAFAGGPSFRGTYEGVDPVLSSRRITVELKGFEPVRFKIINLNKSSSSTQNTDLPLSYSTVGPMGILSFDYLSKTWTQVFEVTDAGYIPPQKYSFKILSFDGDVSEALLILPTGAQVRLKQIAGTVH